jgi:uncharacterized protein
VTSVEYPVLREPTRPVSERAPRFWWWKAAIVGLPIAVVGLVLVIVGLTAVDGWWRLALLAGGVVLIVLPLPWLTVVPRIRYRVHRWDVTDLALHVRHGWLVRTDEIVPISRIQTVDSVQGLLMQAFGLRTVTVKTASSAGTVEIAQLDDETAKAVVAQLIRITSATAEDAT